MNIKVVLICLVLTAFNVVYAEEQKTPSHSAVSIKKVLNQDLAKVVINDLERQGLSVPINDPNSANFFEQVTGAIGFGSRIKTQEIGMSLVSAKVAQLNNPSPTTLASIYSMYKDASVYQQGSQTIIAFQPEVVAKNISDLSSKFNSTAEVKAFISMFVGSTESDPNSIMNTMLQHDQSALNPGASKSILTTANAQTRLIIEQSLADLYYSVEDRIDPSAKEKRDQEKALQEEASNVNLIKKIKDIYDVSSTIKRINQN
jgi:hypothetical protein